MQNAILHILLLIQQTLLVNFSTDDGVNPYCKKDTCYAVSGKTPFINTVVELHILRVIIWKQGDRRTYNKCTDNVSKRLAGAYAVPFF